MTIYQIAILLYFLLYFGVIIGLRSYLLYRNTGINPFRQIGKKGASGFNEKVLSFSTIIVPVVAFNYAFLEENYRLLVPIKYLEIPAIQNIGIGFCLIGLVLVFIAQQQMKSSWRIGLDHKQKSALVIKGLFRLSRNPIYLGLMISFVGFFLLAPNSLSLCFVAMMYITLEMKIRFEEAHLEDNHTDDYKLFKQKVRRWL